MLLKKFLRKYQLKKITVTYSNLSNHGTHRSFCLELMQHLDSVFYTKYSSKNVSGINVSVLFPDIQKYTQRIREINRLLKQEKTISNDWCSYNEVVVNIDSFLVNSNGFYISSVVDVIEDFKQQCIILCNLMEKSDTELYGVHEHNLRVLTKLFINIRHLAFVLINISLTNLK